MKSRRRSAAGVKVSERRQQASLNHHPLSEPCADCGKLRYLTRKAARAARRRTNRTDSLSVYVCGEYWHIGHTPWAVRRGYAERSNMTNRYERNAS